VQVALVCDSVPPSLLVTRLQEAKVRVHLVETTSRGYLSEARAVLALARRLGINVIHTHGYRPDLVVGAAAVLAGLPWVSTAHGFTSESRRMRAYEALQRFWWRAADVVLAVSRPLHQRIIEAGVKPTRVHLVPNAVPEVARVARDEARRRLGIETDAPLVAWIGRLSTEKGPDLALAAWAVMAPPRPSLVIIGDGPERAPLEAARLTMGLTKDVVLLGTRADVREILPAFDLLLLSSRTEGTPMVLLEAMHAGVPIVATCVGGVPDLLGTDAGMIVPLGDAAAMADAVVEILADTALAARLASAAEARMAAHFAHSVWTRRHLDLYAPVVRTPTGDRA